MAGQGGLISFISRARKSFISSIWTPPSGTAQINGDVAVTGETSLEDDLDLNGNYLLNDQTTTNMMSKGTAYRFDGVNDFVDIPITELTMSEFDLSFNFNPSESATADGEFFAFADWSTSTTWFRIAWQQSTANILVEMRAVSVVKWSFTTAVNSFPAGTEHSFNLIHNGTIASAYKNQTALDLTWAATVDQTYSISDIATAGNPADKATLGVMRYNSINNAFYMGTISDFKIHNTALTASEVKDLSANTPFKWIGASQAELVTDEGFDDSASWNLFGGATVDNAGDSNAVITADGTASPAVQSKTNFAITAGKEYTLRYTVVSNTLVGGQTRFNVGSTFPTTNLVVTAGVQQVTCIASSSASGAPIIQNISSDSGGILTISDLSLVRAGVTADYNPQSISATKWYDASGNANDGVVTGATVQHYKGFHSDGTDLFADGAMDVAGALDVTGATTLNGAVDISRAESFLSIQSTTAGKSVYIDFDADHDAIIGVDRSSGGWLISGATTSDPYALVITTAEAYPINFGIGNSLKLALETDGDLEFQQASEIRTISDGLLTLSGGTGGVRLNDAFGLSIAPQAQQAHIIDADGTLADITTKFNTLLADLEGFGLLASA